MSDPTLPPSSLESPSLALDSVHETQSAYGGPAVAPQAQSQGTHAASGAAKQGQANDVRAASGLGAGPPPVTSQANDILAAQGEVTGKTAQSHINPLQPVFKPISSNIASRFEKSTGENVSSVPIAENPDLKKQGKRGVAIDGKCIEVAPGLLGDLNLCAHELTHIVQQRGPINASEAEDRDTQSRDPETEAQMAERAISSGLSFLILQSTHHSHLYFEETPEAKARDFLVDSAISIHSDFDPDHKARVEEDCKKKNPIKIKVDACISNKEKQKTEAGESVVLAMTDDIAKELIINKFKEMTGDAPKFATRSDLSHSDFIDKYSEINKETNTGSFEEKGSPVGFHYDGDLFIDKDKASLSTPIHEQIHALTNEDWLNNSPDALNEGVTEYLTKIAMRGTPYNCQFTYEGPIVFVHTMLTSGVLNEDELATFYFKGSFADFENKINNYLGKGSWKKLGVLLKDPKDHINIKKAVDMIIEKP